MSCPVQTECCLTWNVTQLGVVLHEFWLADPDPGSKALFSLTSPWAKAAQPRPSCGFFYPEPFPASLSSAFINIPSACALLGPILSCLLYCTLSLDKSFLQEDKGWGLASNTSNQETHIPAVAQRVERGPVKQRIASSIPSQGTYLGCRQGLQWGAHKRQPHVDVSLPLSLSLPLYQKINK